MQHAPAFVCYGKPAHRSLPAFEQLVRHALTEARGIFKRGMTCRDITRAIRLLAEQHLGTSEGVSAYRVASALGKLHRRGLIVNDGGTPRRWRLA